jgi:ligand-binding SRPBCC domain-containing protein
MNIHLITFIKASPKIVFDLSRSIDLHIISTERTREEAIAGRISGLIELGDTVTWKARHLFKTRTLTTKITQMTPYTHFTDEMIQGDFKMFRHNHWFSPKSGGTMMKEILEFESPYGKLGKLVDEYFMKDYLRKLLVDRNEIIRQYAEWGGWHKLLENS